MLTFTVRQGMLGEDGIWTKQMPFADGLTPRALALHIADSLPCDVPIDIAVNDRLLTDDDYDDALRDGDHVILCPATLGETIIGYVIYALIVAVVSAGVSLAIQALQPKPKQPDTSFQRGDASSATYSWNGIQTNYGQGWTVPVVYGRHAVGGQVIQSNAENNSTSAWVNDTLTLLLALSEGPIHAIGDTEITANDALGSLSGTTGVPSQGSLPSDIYVNDVLLTNDGQTQIVWYSAPFVGPSNWSSSNSSGSDPDVNIGDLLIFRNDTTNTTYSYPDTRVTEIIGNSSNPNYRMDNPGPQAAYNDSAAGDLVRIYVNAVSSGVFHQITQSGQAPAPQVIRNASAGAQVWARNGALDQVPLPTNVWDGTTELLAQNRTMSMVGETFEISYDAGDQEVAGVRWIVDFPGGLFQTGSNGGIAYATTVLEFRWRQEGTTAWQPLTSPFTFPSNTATLAVQAARNTAFSRYLDTENPGGNMTGSLEFQCKRVTGPGGAGTSSTVRVRDIIIRKPYELTYPRTALMGIALQASARFEGGLPQIHTRIDGLLVRVWDETHGWSERTWDVPAAPFNWHTHPPGRNPAWVLADFITQPWGLGSYFTEDDLDLPAFARWAVYCDRDPNPSDPWDEAQFSCDVVMDQPRPAWEWVVTICAAGRATPVFVNGKLSVVYQYRDAHSQGSVSVPAKSVTQLFTSNNAQDVSVTWLPRGQRPTAIVYQFLNENERWLQDVLTFEDDESTLNDPSELHADQWRPEQQQAYGITRPSQLFRDAKFRHRIHRLVRRQIEFTTGRWALAATIGDLIDVEAEVLRPFDSDVPSNAAIIVGGTSVSVVTVDRTSLPSTGQIAYRKPDGSSGTVNWSSTATTTIEGVACTELTLASAITVNAGATCVVGSVSKLVETYQITRIELMQDLSRKVTALQWVPSIHDDIAPSAFADGTNLVDRATAAVTAAPVEQQTANYDVNCERMPGGAFRIYWLLPNVMQSATTRVYERRDDAAWQLIGTVEGSHLDVWHWQPLTTYEVSIVTSTFNGEARLPDAGIIASVVAPEFSRLETAPVEGVQVGHRSQLRWAPVSTLHAEEYEVREGTQWVGARRLWRGTDLRVDWSVPPLADSVMLCVENEDGSQGQPTTVTLTPWTPDDSVTFVDTDVVQDATGTHDNTQLVGTSYIELTSSSLSGTYTSPELDTGFRGTFLWRVALESREFDGVLVNDVRDFVVSGESQWRTVDAREASRALPGVDFDRDVDDATDKVDAFSDEFVNGYTGSHGRHTRAKVEGRFYEGAAWTDWETWTDQERNASKAQVRVVLDRSTLTHELQIHKLRIAAHL